MIILLLSLLMGNIFVGEERIPVAPPRKIRPVFQISDYYGRPTADDQERPYIEVQVDDHGDQVALWRDQFIKYRGGQLKKIVSPPVGFSETFVSLMKYRNGTFFRREENTIYKLEGDEWKLVLSPHIFFANYEVLEGGDLVLMNTGVPPRYTKTPSEPTEYLVRLMTPGTANFLELYSQNASNPYKTFLYTEELETLNEKWLSSIRGCTQTFKVGSRYLMYYKELGQVWCYDSILERVWRLPLPWGAIDSALLESHKGKIPVGGCYACLEVATNDFIWPLLIFPLSQEEVLIISRNPRPLREEFERRALHLKEQRMVAIPPPKLWEKDERSKEWKSEGVVIDLSNQKSRRLDPDWRDSNPRWHHDMWFDASGFVGTIPDLLKKTEAEIKARKEAESNLIH